MLIKLALYSVEEEVIHHVLVGMPYSDDLTPVLSPALGSLLINRLRALPAPMV